MTTFKATIAYDGTDFAGWQWQPQKRTVQAELEAAVERITQQKSKCVASGRTDAGVHALGQVVGFRLDTKLTGKDLCRALNAEVPEDMFVFEVCSVPDNFHPIRDALRKRYRYLIQDGRPRDIFGRKYVWHLKPRLDVGLMAEAAKTLLGKHDFISFQTTGSSRLTTERTVLDLVVERRQAELTDRIVIEVEADGFLYNMVRNIVGTLVEVGKGKQPITWPAEVIALRDRRAAGMTAPAQGLYLIGVEYGPAAECGVRSAECGLEADEDDENDVE